MEKNLLKGVLRKRCSIAANPNLSSVSIVSTATTLNGYETANEGSDVESLYFSMNGTLQDEKMDSLSESEPQLLTARKKQTPEPNSPHQDLELPSMMFQSTPQILNKSRNIREEIPDFDGNTLHFEEEKSTIVDVGKLTDAEEDKVSFKVLENSVTLFRGEKENNDPVLELKSNLLENFENFKLDDSAQQNKKRQPIPTPRSAVVLSPKNETKPIPSPRKLMGGGAIKKNSELSAIIETSVTSSLVEEKKSQVVVDKKLAAKPTRMTISSRFRKSILPANQTEDSNIPLKRTRKSVAPPPTVVPSTRILRKSIAPTVQQFKSPVKKRQSIAVPAKPKTTSSSSEMANKRRSADNLAKKRQSMAAKGKTPEKRRSTGRSENLKRRQSVAVKPKTPEKRRSAGRKSVVPVSRPAPSTRQSIMPSTSRRSVMPAKAVAPQPQTPLTQAELTCDVCKKIFRLKSNLTAHKRLHDSNSTKSSTSSLKCSYCDKTFALKTAYDNHLTQYCTKIPSNEKKKLMAAGAKSPDEIKNGSSVSNKSGFLPPAKPSAKMHSGIERTPSKTIDCRINGCNRKFKDPNAYTEHSTHHHSMTSSSGDEK